MSGTLIYAYDCYGSGTPSSAIAGCNGSGPIPAPGNYLGGLSNPTGPQVCSGASVLGPSAPYSNPPNYNKTSCGSVINVDTQVLQESIPLVGIPYNLVYSSDRVKGYLPWWQAKIPMTENSFTPSPYFSGIQVSVVSPQQSAFNSTQTFPTAALGSNEVYTYTAPQVDASGNPITQAYLAIPYSRPVYSLAIPENNFALFGAGPQIGIVSNGNASFYIGIGNLSDFGLGGWDLAIHHHYDSARKILFLGDGSTFSAPYTMLTGGNIQVISAEGREVYIFDSALKHLYTKSGLTGVVKYTFAYDSSTNPRLSSVTDDSGNITSFTYGVSGLTQIIAPFGQVTSIGLDANGYLASVSNPSGETYALTSFGNGLLHTYQKPSGVTTTLTYDSSGLLTSDLSSVGSQTSLSAAFSLLYGYNKITTTENTALGRVKTHAFYTSGTDYNRTDASSTGLIETYIQGASSKSSSENTGFTYSDYATNDKRFGSAAQFIYNMSTHDANVTQSVSRSQTVVPTPSPGAPFSYSTFTTTTTVAGTQTTTDVYTASTKTWLTTSPQSRLRTKILDTNERIVSSALASLTPITYSYDAFGHIATMAQGSSRTSTFSYNATTGFLETITNPLSQVNQFSYDLSGRVITQTLPDLRVINYTYDSDGNISSVTPPGKPVHTMSYNGYEFLTQYLSPSPSQSTQFSYDNDRKLSLITRPNGNTIQYNYNSTTGLLSNLTLSAGSVPFTYSSYGYPATATSLDGVKRTMTWNQHALGTDVLLDTSLSKGSTVNYTFNTNFLIASDTISIGSTVNYTYDKDLVLTAAGDETITNATDTGFPTQAAIGSNQKENFSYSSTYGELSQIKSTYGVTNNYQEDLTRDALGRVISRTETYNGTSNVYDYTFDSAGRLTDVFINGAAQSNFSYDTNGNRTGQILSGVSTSATFDVDDSLLTDGSYSFTYNANGEMTTKQNSSPVTLQSYTYNDFGNLKTVTLPSTIVINYKVDASGRRFSRFIGSTLDQIYIYDQSDRIIGIQNSTGSLTARFVYGTRSNVPDYVVKSSVNYQIISNHIGSPVLVINTSTGAIAQEIHYDVWGKITSDTNPGFIPFGFAGGLYDQDTKLTHFGAREYDASIGRWLSKDPILFGGGDTNLYGYVLQDPVNLVDSDGLMPVSPDSPGMYPGIGDDSIYSSVSPVDFIAGYGAVKVVAPTATLATEALVTAFNPGGALNSGRYLRIGFRNYNGRNVFRITGDLVPRSIWKDGHIVLKDFGPAVSRQPVCKP